jgi:hypothetical protein
LLIARSGVSFDTSDRGPAAIREARSITEREHLDMTV